jgi:TPR repeat protein
MKIPWLLGLLALCLVPPSLASAQSDNAYTAYGRKDFTALTRMAEAGDALAQYNLGVIYGRGEGVEQDYALALKWYRKAADQGLAEAQYNLGVIYVDGEGIEQDYVQALKWYNLSAAQGYAGAQNNLGLMFDNGNGVARNSAEAVKWYRLSAAQGYALAQYNLGVMYENGRGVGQNYVQALEWYRKAVNQGLAEAQNNLGLMFDNGNGVARNSAEAVKWYRLSAAQGYALAQYNLGFSYHKGEGVEQDYALALEWYRKAVNQGLAAAQNNLGVMYESGEGVEQDYVQALKWYNLSAAQGYETAKTNRDALAALMTSAQIAEAQRLALNVKPMVQPPLAVTVAPPPIIRTVSVPPSASTKITLSSNGKTIIISGGIERGSAERFKILLDAVPSVENVALISSGGDIDEATEMYQAIKTRALDTYVDQYCMSACTMIFLGGRDRSAAPQAKIGFHKPYLMTDKPVPDAAVEAEMRRFYDEANVRPSFTDKSMSTPSSGMWYPSFDELLASNVVTKRILGGEVSSFANIYRKRSDVENGLSKGAVFGLIKSKHPDIFAEIVDAAWTAQQEGKTDGEVGNALRAKMTEKYSIILASADDAVFDRYIRLVLAQYKAARDISFEACALLNQGKLDIIKNLPLHFAAEEFALLEAALRSNQKRLVITEKQVEDFWPDIFADMTEIEIQAISDPANSSPIDVCNSGIKIYSAIEGMPMTDRVLVARYLLLSE